MAPPRIVDPFGYYHLGTKGNFGDVIFEGRTDFEKYLQLYERVSRRWAWTTLDWCLMHNHVHVVIKLNGGGLSEGMQELNGCYSKWLNRKKGRIGQGHTFKNRFFSDRVDSELHLRVLFAYVPLNPIDAHLCDHPQEWHWSGCGAALGVAPRRPFHDVDVLLAHFGGKPAVAADRYRRYLEDALLHRTVVESAA
jgi:REP-associated tyrosine transposase